MNKMSPWFIAAAFLCAHTGVAQTLGTALVRNAPQLNGTVDGNLQQMTGKSVTLNGGAVVTGDLLVPGTPSLQVNGTPNFGGVIVGTGNTAPSNYKVTLNGSVRLGHLCTRTDAIVLPVLPSVPSPTGTRNVVITAAGQSIGDFTNLRNLTLNGNVGQYKVPPGTFGDFTANGGSGFTLGVAGSSQPAVYNLQHLTLNGQTNLLVVGPVVINVANGLTGNGTAGTSTSSSWLRINIPSGGLTLNGGSTLYGYVTAPNGTVIINGNAKLVGGAICNGLTVNGNGLLQLLDTTDFENHAPTAIDQAATTDQDVSKGLVLEATDPDGQTLTYTILSSPAHGALDGTPPNLTYTPFHSYSGTDVFTFKANDGEAESNVATVFITVMHVNHPPTADSQTLALDQDGSVSLTLIGGDIDGDSLTFRIISIPAHGSLSGVAPNLTYTPALNFYGSDSFSFVVNDGAIDSSSAVVSISVNHVNHPPNAIGQNVTLDEDTNKAITLTGSDSDGDVLSFAIVEQPRHGTLTGLLPNLIYQPVPDYFGDDLFTFRTNDGVTDSTNLGFVSITIRSINDAPTVVITTPAGGTEFDSGNPIHIGAAAADKDGTISTLRLFSDGAVIYETQQATAVFDLLDAPEGDHALTAIAVDNEGASATSAAVTISVRGQGNGPVQVNAGPDRLISLPAAAHLEASATVNGTPAGGDVQLAWEEVSGPGTASFDGSSMLTPSVTFSAPGDYVLKLVATAPEGTGSDTVKVTALAAPQAGPDSPISNQGREFWMAFLSQQPPNYEPDHAGAFLIISSEVAASGTVEIWSALRINGAWQTSRRTETFAVEAGEKTVVEAVGSFSSYDDQYDQALPTAVHVQADAPVAVHALNYNDYSTDGSLILPNGVLGREYFVMSYRNSGDPTDVIGGTQVAVVATKDPTQITITPTASTLAHPAGQAFSITLHTGEVYRMINNDNPEADFTGTRVQSDQPVAVFGGHTCAQVPAEIPYCDHLYEQMPPVDFWGRHFITLPLKTRSGGDRYKLLAAKDGTRISVNGQILATLNAGQFYETVLDQPTLILGDHPILLAQLAQSSDFDHTTGDPFLTLIPPYEEFGRHYILGTQALHSYYTESDIDIFDSYLGLIVDSAQTGSVTLNGQPVVPSEFTAIGDSGFSGASLSVPKDTTLNVSAAVPIGAWLYGWASYESYGFTGGLYGAIDTATAQFELTQSASSAPLGSVHHVIASLVSSAGLPVPDAEVAFSVTGANPISGTEMTAPDGTIEFSWTGQQPGDDIVTATTGALSSSLSVTWVAGGGNQPPQVNAGPDVLLNLGQLLALHGTVQDDGLPFDGSLTLKWSVLPGPGDVTFTDRTSVDASATFLYPGRYHLRLTAFDGQFAGEDDLLVTVNSPPAFFFLDPSAETIGAGKYWSVGVSAEDQDGLIAKIELIDANEVLAVLQPNSQTVLYLNAVLSTTFSAVGTHSLVVRLTDDRGATADRAIDVTVRPVPTVQILTPADNTSVAAGESVAFTASASSPNGTITRVVYSDVTDNYPFEVGDGAGSNYQLIWTPTYTGTRLIAATAYDSTGASGDSAAITINLQSPGDPTISITSPSEGNSVYLGQTLTIQAEASAVAPAEIGGVYFYDDDTFLGYDYSAPFELSWTPNTLGVHSLTGGVYDSFGGEASTAITVNVVSVPPLDVSVVQPLDNSYLQVNQSTVLVANIENLVGVLDRIDFYVNGTLIGNGSSDSVTWTPPAIGDYALEAYAYSSSPSQNGNQVITVHVADLHPPVVQLSSPANGTSFPPGTPIFLQAQASDVDWNLSLLQFQEKGNLLSETALSGGNGAATFTWENASPGWHGVDAVATDTTSQVGAASVRIFVQRPINNVLLPPSGLTANAISAGSIQLNWIASSSQNSAATVVERRTGMAGAWEEIGTVDPAAVSYEDNTLESESYYSYRLAVLDGDGARSAYSQESSATTMVQLPQYAVIDLGESLDQTLVSLDFIKKRFLYSQNNRGPLPLGGILDLKDADVMSIAENNDILLKKADTTSDGQTTIVYYFLYHPETQQSDYIGDPSFRAIRLSRDGVVAGAVDHSMINQNGVADWIYTGLEFWLGVGSRPGIVREDGSRIDIRAATWTPAGGVQEVMPAEANQYRYDRLDLNPARMFPKPFDSLYSAWDVSRDGTVVGTGSWGDLRGISPATPLDSIASYEIYTRQHAMRWRSGQWDTLGSLRAQSFGEGESIATAVSPLGTVVVGGSAAPDRAGDPPLSTHGMRSQMPFGARLLEPGDPALQDLAPLGDGSYSWASDVDTAGGAVGYSTKHQSDSIVQFHAAYWAFGSSTALELPDLGGHNTQFPEGYGYANAINEAGDRVVGKSLREDETTAGTVWALNANKGGDGLLWEAADLTPHIPSDWFVVEAVDLNKNGFIVGIAYHTIPDPDNPNGPPAQLKRSVLLVPVELRDIKRPEADDDDIIIVNIPAKARDESDNAYFQRKLDDKQIAYIEPHGAANGVDPEMPHLLATLPNGLRSLKAKWRLEIQYERGNGYRPPYVQDFTRPEDTVSIPAAGPNGEPVFTTETDADQDWRIFETSDWQNEITQRGFFGGTAKLYLWLSGDNESAPTEPVVTFRIGGKNPNQGMAKAFINSVAGSFWHAYAIAKHETFGRVREDGSIRFYNQFYTDYQGGPIGDASVDMGWAAWAKSWPVYNLDRGSRVGPQNGPGGYGLFQLTLGPKDPRGSTAEEDFISRGEIWNWQDNVRGALQELWNKVPKSLKLLNGLQATYQSSGAIPNHLRFSSFDAIVITYYNGMSGAELKRIKVDGYRKRQTSCWEPLSTGWKFLPNVNNYVDSVSAQLE